MLLTYGNFQAFHLYVGAGDIVLVILPKRRYGGLQIFNILLLPLTVCSKIYELAMKR